MGFQRSLKIHSFSRPSSWVGRVLKISQPQLQFKFLKDVGEVIIWRIDKKNCSAFVCLFWCHSLYSRHPNGLLKTHTGTRRARPRSVFNVRLFNGNLESFIKVLIISLSGRRRSSSFSIFCLALAFWPFWWVPPKHLSFDLSSINNNEKLKQHICAKMASGNLPHESVSSGSLCLRCRGGGWHWQVSEGCRRRGLAVGGINVCLRQLPPDSAADLASLSRPGRDPLVLSSSRAGAGASESSRVDGSQGADAAELIRYACCLPPPASRGLSPEAEPAWSCPALTVFFWVGCQHRVEWGVHSSSVKSFGGQLLWS